MMRGWVEYNAELCSWAVEPVVAVVPLVGRELRCIHSCTACHQTPLEKFKTLNIRLSTNNAIFFYNIGKFQIVLAFLIKLIWFSIQYSYQY